jgi:hypothetical protein
VISPKACRWRVVLFFGPLLLAAVLAVPYRETHVLVAQEGRWASYAKKTTTVTDGYMLLPRFLSRRGDWTAASTREELKIRMRIVLYAAEIGAVAVLGVLDFLLFCLRRPHRRTPRVKT